MSTINGTCFTNLDEFAGVEWPERFVAVPRIGDRVEGRRVDGRKGSTRPNLRVVGVTHRQIEREPLIVVELHK